MAFVYIAPLANRTAFKIGKACAPSSRISQLSKFYDFDLKDTSIISCKTASAAFALESILHKLCSGGRKLQQFDGGTEFFDFSLFDGLLETTRAICKMRGYKMGLFVAPSAPITQLGVDEVASIASAFAAKIKARRLEMNLLQLDVAIIAGVSKRTIERIERCGNGSFLCLIAVLRALNLADLIINLETGEAHRERASAPSFWDSDPSS